MVDRTGNALRALGIEPEQRVALVLPDSPEFVAAFLGAIKIGAIPVTLSTLLTEGDYAYLLADCRARAVVVADGLLSRIGPARGELRDLRHVIVAGQTSPGTIALSEITAGASDKCEAESTGPDDMCFWQYSSGTTGAPKAVVHLQRSAMAPAELHGRHVVAMRPDDRVFSVAKLCASG